MQKDFGTVEVQKQAVLYNLENKNGMRAAVSSYGAVLVSLLVPDADGKLRDVVLGYDTAGEYQRGGGCFGATIGRCGNRTEGAQFTLNDRVYHLGKNEGENNLHSGPDRYDFMFWEVLEADSRHVKFFRRSPDGEQGFPGNFDISVTYVLTDENELQILYHGICDQDTVANMTNHSYFNLNGHDSGDVLGHTLHLRASYFTPVRADFIPTGEIRSVEGTAMDFRKEKEIGKDIESGEEQLLLTSGYDHNYALDTPGFDEPFAVAKGEKSGIVMRAYTDCPGVQFYTANAVQHEKGKGGSAYEKRSGFCLETQYFPNSANEKKFASPILKAGEVYETKTVYSFGI